MYVVYRRCSVMLSPRNTTRSPSWMKKSDAWREAVVEKAAAAARRAPARGVFRVRFRAEVIGFKRFWSPGTGGASACRLARGGKGLSEGTNFNRSEKGCRGKFSKCI